MPRPAAMLDGTSPTTAEVTPATRNWAVPLVVAATLVTMAPWLLLIAKFAFRDVLLTGDFAVIDARIRDVWTSDIPLVGPYSNGWNHPGPLYFYLFAPLHKVAGDAAWTIPIGGALIACAAIALSARLAWRRAGLGFTLLILATFALSTLGATDRLVLDAWNPHVAMPLFVLLILQLWSIAEGDRWQILGVAIVGSYVMQTHIGYIPLVIAGSVVTGVIALRKARADRAPLQPWIRPLVVSAATAFVLWIPPIIDQLTNDPGNVRRIERYFRDSPEPSLGFRDGARTFAALFRPIPTWLGGGEQLEPLSFQPTPRSLWWLLIPAGLLIGAYVTARRARLAPQRRLLEILGTLTVVGVVALGRLRDGARAWSYMSLWRIPIAVLIVTVAAWTFWKAWTPRPAIARKLAIAAAGGLILLGTIPITVEVADTSHVASFHDIAAGVLDQIDSDDVKGSVLVRNVAPALGGVAPALVNKLDRDGVKVRVDRRDKLLWDSSRVADPGQVDEVWVVTEEGVRGSLLTASPDARVVARTTPLSPREERELTRLQRQLALEILDAGRGDLVAWLEREGLALRLADELPELDPVALRRVAELDAKVGKRVACRCLVVAYPPDRLPSPLADG